VVNKTAAVTATMAVERLVAYYNAAGAFSVAVLTTSLPARY